MEHRLWTSIPWVIFTFKATCNQRHAFLLQVLEEGELHLEGIVIDFILMARHQVS